MFRLLSRYPQYHLKIEEGKEPVKMEPISSNFMHCFASIKQIEPPRKTLKTVIAIRLKMIATTVIKTRVSV